MQYQTRRLQALRDFPLGNEYLHAGDEFIATHVDAEYLTKQHRKGPFAKNAVPFAPASDSSPAPEPGVVSAPAPQAPAESLPDAPPALVAPAKRPYVRRTTVAEK